MIGFFRILVPVGTYLTRIGLSQKHAKLVFLREHKVAYTGYLLPKRVAIRSNGSVSGIHGVPPLFLFHVETPARAPALQLRFSFHSRSAAVGARN